MADPKADDTSSWPDPSTPWRSWGPFFQCLETDCRPVGIQTNKGKLCRARTVLGSRESMRPGKTRFQLFRHRGGAVRLVRSMVRQGQGSAGTQRRRRFSYWLAHLPKRTRTKNRCQRTEGSGGVLIFKLALPNFRRDSPGHGSPSLPFKQQQTRRSGRKNQQWFRDFLETDQPESRYRNCNRG
jgi:hypothetical protein